jgi:hypothetical protein
MKRHHQVSYGSNAAEPVKPDGAVCPLLIPQGPLSLSETLYLANRRESGDARGR